MSYSGYEKNRAWLRAKAKDARSLSAEEEVYLDRELAMKLRERMEHEASVRWWQLFGLEGHRLDSMEAEAQFITHLDKIFKCPPASEFLAPTDTKRRLHHAYHFSRQGVYHGVEYLAPPTTRLLELMLYGYFPYGNTWIYLDRRSQLSSDGYKKPKQWLALPPGETPQDRLGITIEISVGWKSLIRSQSPAALFSSLRPFEKESLAREFGSEGSHQYWLEQIVEGLFFERGHRSRISISYAGESEGLHLTLAELIAEEGRTPGKKVVMQDGNYLNCEPGNLIVRSSRGRTMSCKTCRRPTTKDQSEITKDSLGSSLRICHSCLRWLTKTSD
ncbi:hypothetical protein PUR31_02330 [Pseudomonas mosselii]|uniref:hypothetical protein n=1 Tax=unclassified Pseudomonas TaxID=196821 RepID=UPI0020C23F42|nr:MULTISPECIES: hypothetical protein [unclassified Pseudomonas]MCP8633425.1 hypothetical protein [Pseudomonas sp. DVZ6]MDD7782930.1 hypothetical protein [Pseudomonas sp. DVZ24]